MSLLKPFIVLLLSIAALSHLRKPFYLSDSPEFIPSAVPPFPDFVKALRYPVETHQVTTDDGYILTLFRIQTKDQANCKSGLPVVFLQHGFTDSGDTWIVDDENNAPGLKLANEGFDVWVGNSRGTKYSLNHTSLNSSNPAFWQFSWQNMSHYDLPAVFEYIGEQTGELINYIGHSQGTTIMFAALSEREPLVMKYLKKFIALSPVAWVQYIKSGAMHYMAYSSLATLLETFHINQFLAPNFLESDFGHLFCKIYPLACGDFLKFLVGTDPEYDNYARYDIILQHEPGGTSTMDALHWRQEILQAKFNKYDYGKDGNMFHYNQATPPDYNVSNINVPVYMFIGSDDTLVDPRDTQTLVGNLTGSPYVDYKMYPAGHMTFIWSKNISFYFNGLMEILHSDNDTMIEY